MPTDTFANLGVESDGFGFFFGTGGHADDFAFRLFFFFLGAARRVGAQRSGGIRLLGGKTRPGPTVRRCPAIRVVLWFISCTVVVLGSCFTSRVRLNFSLSKRHGRFHGNVGNIGQGVEDLGFQILFVGPFQRHVQIVVGAAAVFRIAVPGAAVQIGDGDIFGLESGEWRRPHNGGSWKPYPRPVVRTRPALPRPRP